MAQASASGILGFTTNSSDQSMTRVMMNFGTFNNGIVISKLEIGAGTTSGAYLARNAYDYGRTLTYTLKGSTSGSVTIYNQKPPVSGNYTNCPGATHNMNATFYGTVTLQLTVSGQVVNQVHWGCTSSGYSGTITYTDATTACTAPTSVSVSRTRGTFTITWSGAGGGTNNAISNYGVIRNTSASTSGATTVSSGGSSGLTNSPGAGTYYYGVRTQGAAGSSYYSGYKWSSAVTMPSKPSTVSAGTAITKAQMDALKSWINSSSITTVTQGGTATAAQGNTYRSGLTAGSTQFDDAWYNAALG